MEPEVKNPTTEEIKSFLEGYGWHYKETASNDGKATIISPYTLEKENKGILISFRVEKEFVMVSTVDFLKGVPKNFSQEFLGLNDKLKLIKLFSADTNNSETFDAEVGFELWNKSWNRETFYSFMDMLCLGIEKIVEALKVGNIPYQTSFVTYS